MMSGPDPRTPNFALFDTVIGWCGVAWSEPGIVGVQLPEGGEQATRSRLRRRFPDAGEPVPPAPVQHVISQIVALLDGERPDLRQAVLDPQPYQTSIVAFTT